MNVPGPGVYPNAVGDGMDTWHWWAGVDNPVWWRKATVLTGGKEYSALNVRLDFFCLLQTISRADRWAKMGLINDPDTVPADKPDQYGLMADASIPGQTRPFCICPTRAART